MTDTKNTYLFCDQDSEKCILGAILLDFSIINDVTSKITVDDFYFFQNRIIFETLKDLKGKIQQIDLQILTTELEKTGNIEKAGGPSYIGSLTNTVSSAANIDYYLSKLIECRNKRRCREISLQINDDFIRNKDSTQIVESARHELMEIESHFSFNRIYKGFDLMVNAGKEIEDNIKNWGKPKGVLTGFDKLDAMLCGGLQKSHLIILAARPSIGKTAMALSIMENTINKGNGAGFISLEMSKEELATRLISQHSGISGTKLRSGTVNSEAQKKICDTLEYYSRLPFYIADLPNGNLSNINSISRNLVLKNDVKVIFIDYIGLIKIENNTAPVWERIDFVINELKSLAKELKIPVVALCQLNRDAEGNEPTLANLRGSGSVEQGADEVLILHGERDIPKETNDKTPENPVIKRQLIIEKQRNGPLGKIDLNFIKSLTKFQEA